MFFRFIYYNKTYVNLFFYDFSEKEKSSFDAKGVTAHKIITQTLNYLII